jgi:L-gulono-1,4-lactone dehydrogenase
MAEQVRRRWRNWSGEQQCRPLRIARPRTREGLVAALIEANRAERRIKVAGSGHSFTGAALTDGTLLDLGLLNRVLEVDRPGGLVKVEAGIVLADLNRRLDQRGLALESLGDIDRQTLAGSISTATHGTGIRFRNLSSQVVAIEIVGADGTLRELSEASDPDGWRAARVGLGALGAIYSLTLRTVTNFRIDRSDRQRPLAEVLAALDSFVDELDHFEFYVFPHTEIALCRESMRTQVPARPASPAATYAQEVVLENWAAAGVVQLARHVPAAIPTLSRVAAAGTGKSHKVDRSYRVYASERRIKFTEMEYSIPRASAREAVERVLKIAARPELQVPFPIEVRFTAGDDAMLSPAHGRDSCYVAVHHDRYGDWQPYFEAVAAVMADYGGRPHWGKRHQLGASELAKLYPRFDDFKAVRARLDPDSRFANPYTEQVLGSVPEPKQGRRRWWAR